MLGYLDAAESLVILYDLSLLTHLCTLNHALLVEHEQVAAAVQDGASFHSQICIASVLLLLKT